jgi:hypothetical protein
LLGVPKTDANPQQAAGVLTPVADFPISSRPSKPQ